MLDQLKPIRESDPDLSRRLSETAETGAATSVESWVGEALEWVSFRLSSAAGERTAAVEGMVEELTEKLRDSADDGCLTVSQQTPEDAWRLAVRELRARLLDTWPEGDDSTPARLRVLRRVEHFARELEDSDDGGGLKVFSSSNGGELVVQLAHDLRSPLTSILFLAETLRRGQSGELNQLQGRQIGLIYAAALGLSSISGDVMELARGGTGLVEEEPAPFSVAEVFESVKNMVQPLAEEKGLDLRLTHSVSDHWSGHPLALSRVLLNLTTNSLKFTENGFVEIGARATGLTALEFWVKDSGPGIPSHARQDLFKMFRNAPSRGRTQFSGTGLGLYICRDLVEKMDSELAYETAAGSGTRFFFELRLDPAGRI